MLIREKLDRDIFSHSEMLLIRYIKDHPKEIVNMTTKEIANAAYSSPSTLIRIAHKMNFKGWNELKAAFIKENDYLETHFCDIDANLPFNNNDTIMSIAAKIAQLEQETIADTLSLITHDDLQQAIKILNRANVVHVFAVSNNLLIAKEFEYLMARIQKPVIIHDLQGEVVFNALLATPDSCALVISYSGETPTLIQCVTALKSNHIPILAITNIGDNTIARTANCVLKITTREKLYSKIGNFSATTAISYLLNVLYSCIFSINYDFNLKLKIEASKQIEKGRFSTIDIIKEDIIED